VFNAGTTPDWIQTIQDITPQIARAQEKAILSLHQVRHVQSFTCETFNRETGGGEVRLFLPLCEKKRLGIESTTFCWLNTPETSNEVRRYDSAQ